MKRNPWQGHYWAEKGDRRPHIADRVADGNHSSVRSPFRSDLAAQLLTRDLDALLGVSDAAAELLGSLGIRTIADLAASVVFHTARRVVETIEPAGTPARHIGSDVVTDALRGASADEVANSPVHGLRLLDAQFAQKLSRELGVKTIRELALWPPYVAARAIVNDAYGTPAAVSGDDGRPDDLVPVARRYATERVQYDVVVMQRVLDPYDGRGFSAADFRPRRVDLAAAGAIDVGDLVSAADAARPAVGAVLTYRQSWFPQGLALGQLLHSMALAPGESTRVAMVDWNRVVRASATDETTQSEALFASIERTRAMSEVTSAVAAEAQSGFSGSASAALHTEAATSAGIAGVIPFAGAAVGAAGASFAAAGSATTAAGWASSSGTRSLNAEMAQNIADRTHQASNSVRNRRATAITETSQKESETLTTRVVTNYNHMHALTVQYFEVVQIYRVVVELARVTRCLFVPMKLVTFTSELLRRYRSQIARVGLTPEVRSLATAMPDTLVVRAPRKQGNWEERWLALAKKGIGESVGAPADEGIHLPLQDLVIWGVSGDRALAENFERAELITAGGERLAGEQFAEFLTAYTEVSDGLPRTRPVRDYRRIILRRKPGRESFSGSVTIRLSFDIDGNPSAAHRANVPQLMLGATMHIPPDEPEITIFTFQPSIADADLLEHLQHNALHYSSAIWRALDASTVTTLLSSYELDGQRLIEVIDPIPVTTTGNYIVFRLYGGEESREWRDFLERHELLGAPPLEDFVPLPSGGVFAEAVLGRSNSAERLDLTRFWDWQASPIPIGPPEINPLTAGGKANDATPNTPPLEAPVVNIVNPPALPDPAGRAPALSALTTRELFRDMSGLAATAALAQSVMGAAQAGAGNASSAATVAQQTAAQLFRDVAELAVKAAGASMGIPPVGGAPGGVSSLPPTPTNVGAALAAARDLDSREASVAKLSEQDAPDGDPDEWLPFPGSAPAQVPLSPPPLLTASHEAAVLHGTRPVPRTPVRRKIAVTLRTRISRDGKPADSDFVDIPVGLEFRRAQSGNPDQPLDGQLTLNVQDGTATALATLQPGVPYTVRAPGLTIPGNAIRTQFDFTIQSLFGAIPLLQGKIQDLANLAAAPFSVAVPIRVRAEDNVVIGASERGLILELVFDVRSDPNSAVDLKINADLSVKGSAGVSGTVDLAELAKAIAEKIAQAHAALAARLPVLAQFVKLGQMRWEAGAGASGGFDVSQGGTLRYVPETIVGARLQKVAVD